jgi:serine/threonine-protein kinase
VAERVELIRLIRAALVRGITAVELSETHLAPGPHVLQVRLRGRPVLVLAAEGAGETATGSFALRLAPLDPSHLPELEAIAEGTEEILPPSNGPMSSSASAIFDSEPPLPMGESVPFAPGESIARSEPGGRRFAATIPDDDPEEVTDSDLGASVLFDPEAALISKAPPRPDGTRPDDTLTVPLRASMVPPNLAPPTKSVPPQPPRTASGPHTISHLSIPSATAVPKTERLEARNEVNAASERHAMTERHGSRDNTMSVDVDFDTAQSLVDTQRTDEDEWTNDGAGAADPSFSGSVVIDPDILAREQRADLKTTQPMFPETPPAELPPQSEAYTVVFDNDPTAPGILSNGRPAGVLVSKDDEASLTPTVPMDIPASRAAASSGRGPRTQKRTTGSGGIIGDGRIIANRYRIESMVGAGAVGAVYRAVHLDLPRTFAIKVLHPHFRKDQQLMASFRTEARAASLLDHPNVTVVHDFGVEPDGLVYIVMEYLAGVTLQKILEEERRLGPRRAIDIMLQVCGALAAAHERGIVHRDVKPDNIMLVPSRDDEGRAREVVKVCDFGIAALESTPIDEDPEWTAGTPEYMAPEQAHGRTDARTDVYACGIVLYEMLVGRPPFLGESPLAVLARHANERAVPPSQLVQGIPAALEAAIMRAIEKAPERRQGTVRELRVELKRLLS